MKRRDFLLNSTLAGATTLIGAACNPSANQTSEVTAGETVADEFELNEITIDALQSSVANNLPFFITFPPTFCLGYNLIFNESLILCNGFHALHFCLCSCFI